MKPEARQHKIAASSAGPGQVRLIGGRWKRSVLRVSNLPGLRPTPNRVRETLFNWLGQDLTGWHCVDAFAGTGALGFEAASRGAAQVWLCEQAPVLAKALEKTKTQFGATTVQVVHGDALTLLQRLEPGSVDVVFLDPPFDAEALFAPALAVAVRLVDVAGYIYFEAPQRWSDDALAAMGLSCQRYLHAGAVHAHLLQKLMPEAA